MCNFKTKILFKRAKMKETIEQIMQRAIWQTTVDLGFKFNESDSWTMQKAIMSIIESELEACYESGFKDGKS